MLNEEMLNKYEVTVGIECHVQLATKSKLFSSADNDERGKSPNSAVSPIDYALPGMLPVLNKRAVELAIVTAAALNSKINPVSRFDRKHYFYPDLPKGYQISQMYQPTIGPGVVHVPMEDGSSFDVRINHAHLEEDAGKLSHISNYSLVDLNRAGTPLIEIVSEPDIHSSAQAKAYAYELYKLMTYSGVTRGDLYHGNMRFDVNVSVALKGSKELGIRAEMKNLNSFRSVERAVDYEFRRQAEILEQGDKVIQETRGWDEDRQKTFTQRSKENAQDYRYMPEPDVPPIVLSIDVINEIQSTMPKLPTFYRNEWLKIGFSNEIIYDLLRVQSVAQRAQRIFEKANDDRLAFRIGMWLLRSVGFVPDDSESDNREWNVNDSVTDNQYIELAKMVEARELSSTTAKIVLDEMSKQGADRMPKDIAIEKNLLQISEDDVIEKIIDEVLADPSSQQAIDDLKNGNEKVMGFLVGQVMRKSGGRANPTKAQEILKRKVQ